MIDAMRFDSDFWKQYPIDLLSVTVQTVKDHQQAISMHEDPEIVDNSATIDSQLGTQLASEQPKPVELTHEQSQLIELLKSQQESLYKEENKSESKVFQPQIISGEYSKILSEPEAIALDTINQREPILNEA